VKNEENQKNKMIFLLLRRWRCRKKVRTCKKK